MPISLLSTSGLPHDQIYLQVEHWEEHLSRLFEGKVSTILSLSVDLSGKRTSQTSSGQCQTPSFPCGVDIRRSRAYVLLARYEASHQPHRWSH